LKMSLVTSNMLSSGASRIVSAVSLPPHDSVLVDCLPVGDAAGACDPLTGDGVLHALRSAVSAVDALLQPPGCREASVAAYHAAMHDRFASYLGMRERIYATERRWVRFPFWQRRLTKQAARASEAVQ
jgi:flavin-dependent dehydrogenase